jgi:hypothetical protein
MKNQTKMFYIHRSPALSYVSLVQMTISQSILRKNIIFTQVLKYTNYFRQRFMSPC